MLVSGIGNVGGDVLGALAKKGAVFLRSGEGAKAVQAVLPDESGRLIVVEVEPGSKILKVKGVIDENAVSVQENTGRIARLRNWWQRGAENDAAWRALPLKDKLYYEIGQKTLPGGQYAKYADLSAVERGQHLVRDLGRFRATFMPQGRGWMLGMGSTLSSGPTPLVRWLLPRAAGAGAVGSGGYLLWRYTGSDDE